MKTPACKTPFSFYFHQRQHRTIPALRLKHRSGSCGTASALPKCSIMSGCGTRIVLRGQKPLALCDRCPCFGSLFPPLAGAHLCSIQYYLRFWLGICRTSLAVSALRIMRYCLGQSVFIISVGRGRPIPPEHWVCRYFKFLQCSWHYSRACIIHNVSERS